MSVQNVQGSRHIRAGEAAKLLGVSSDTVRRWAHRGQLRHIVLPSGQLRFRPEDLEAALRVEGADSESSDDSPFEGLPLSGFAAAV